MKRVLSTIALGLLFITIKPDGTLDTTFGNGAGYVASPISFFASSIAVQQDGKIVVGGSDENTNFKIVRYNVDGSFDTSFGSNNGISTGPAGYLFDILVDSDGYITAGGQDLDGNFQLAKFYPQGFSDSSFGNNGVVNNGIPGFCSAIAQQDANYIIAAGADNGGYFNESYFFVARYDLYGNVDTYFDLGPLGYVEDLIIQPDGKVVVCGVGGDGFNFIVIRYNNDGTIDTTFGVHGIVTGPHGVATSLVLQSNGYIVVAGFDLTNPSNMLLIRLNALGNLDTTFGNDGIVHGTYGMINGMTLQSDGKLVVVGANATERFLARFNQQGTLDPTFGINGMVIAQSGVFSGVASQANGNIITVGLDGTYSNFLVARYTNSQHLTPTQISYPVTGATGSVTIYGTAQNPSILFIFLDGELVGVTPTNMNGNNTWNYTLDVPTPNLYNVRVVSIYKPGNLVMTGSQLLRIYN